MAGALPILKRGFAVAASQVDLRLLLGPGAVSMPPIGITVLIAALASKDEDQRPSCGRARAVTVLATVPRVDI